MSEPALLAAPAPRQIEAGRYVAHFGDFRTGDIAGTLPCSAFSWTSELRGTGTCQVTVPPSTEATEMWQATQAGRAMVAVEWVEDFGSRIVWASPAFARSMDATTITVGGSGMFGFLSSKRILIPNVTASAIPTAAKMTFTGDQGTLMRGVLAQALSLPQGDLPIVLEAARSGTRTQSYDGFDLAMVGQRISELADQDPGTDFAFLPRFEDSAATSLVWDFITGTEAQPLLNSAAGAPIVVDGTAPGQDTIQDFSWDESTSDMGTHVFAKGGGTEGGTVIRSSVDSSLTSQGWPRMDAVTTNESVDGTTVQRYADGALAQLRRPLRSIRVKVRASFWWGQGARLGDSVRVMYDHPIAGLVDVTSRLLSESGDIASPWVDLTLADTLAEEVS